MSNLVDFEFHRFMKVTSAELICMLSIDISKLNGSAPQARQSGTTHQMDVARL
jgi:hypothetical protein